MAKRVFLILEDNAEDAFFIRRAFVESECEPFVCRNTSEARAHLLGAGMYRNRKEFPFPEVVISDLRLEAESGLQFLRWFRSQNEFKDLPFVLLSGAVTAQQNEFARQLGASRVLIKPGDFVAFHDLIVRLLRELCRAAPKNRPERILTA
jgi:CheY-like chemotaxis protein